MVLNDEPIFNNCLIKTLKNKEIVTKIENENIKTLEETKISFLELLKILLELYIKIHI